MSENDCSVFLVPQLRQANFKFELYDLSPLIYNESLNKNYADHVIDDYKNFEILISQNLNFIVYFGDTFNTRKIFNIFRKNVNKNYFRINNGIIGSPKRPPSIKDKFLKFILNPKKIIDYIYIKFTAKVDFHNFVSGTSNDGVEIPSFEYENILRHKSDGLVMEKKYHLFLDQNLCYHRDIKDIGYRLVNKPSEYFSDLNLFFDEIERQTGKKVVIALHPRANPDLYYFSDRELILGKTDELVLGADLVMGHFSTAIHYALLCKKDLLLLTTDSVSSFGNNLIDDFSRILKVPILNASNVERGYDFRKYINHSEYSYYVNKYIASKSVVKEHNSAGDIIIKYISTYIE
jgi:hypothetical protein